MTEDVNGACSVLNQNPNLIGSVSTPCNVSTSVSQLEGALYLNPNMTIDGSCLYTAADLAGSFPEGTVLQILPDSTILAVPPPVKEIPGSALNNATIIFKDSSFPTGLTDTPNSAQISNLIVENNDHNRSPGSEVPMYSEGNIDIDLSFLNDAEESENVPLSKGLNDSTTKLQEMMPIESSQSIDIDQNNHSNNEKDDQELQTDLPKESEAPASGVVMIDVSKPIQLSQNSLIMVNGQKCVLQHDAQTGQVIAYPVKVQDKPRRKRGRPRKSSVDSNPKDSSLNSEPAEPENNSDEGKGLLEIVNDDGSLVRRSSRKRKKAKVLKDYETGNLKQELGSDVDEPDPVQADPELNSRKKKSKGPGRPRKHPPVSVDAFTNEKANGVKRQRGRPRKQTSEDEPTQAFLVQTADGQTLMMQVPLSSIPPGVSLQEVAQNIANRLNNVGFSQSSYSLDVGSILQPIEKSNPNHNLENPGEPAVQDHSIGSTTNFSSVDQFQSVESGIENSNETLSVNVNDVIVDSMGDLEVREVILENEDGTKAPNSQPESLIPENILQNPAPYTSLEMSQSPEDNFSLSIPTSNSSSINITSSISSLPESLNSLISQSKTDEQDLEATFNQFQIAKDFLISGDFIKGKVNLNQLLDNVVNTTATSQLSDTCTDQTNSSNEKNISSADSEVQYVLNENSSLKDFENDFASQSMNGEKIEEEKQYNAQEVSDLDESEKLNKNFDFLNCDITNSNIDSNTEKNASQNHSIISSIVHDHDLLVNSQPFSERTEVIESSFSKKDNSVRKKTFKRILPLKKAPLRTTSNETTVLSGPATTVVPVSSSQQLQLSEKILPVILSPQELPGSQKCKVCQRPYFTEEEIVKHFKAEHPKCICSQCNYMADQPYLIKRHSIRHAEIGIVCDICGKHYKDHYILKMHVKMVHMPAEVMFTCEICLKKFTRKAHLKRHLRIHAPSRPYKCSVCSYRGCEKSDITKHLLIHEAPKHKCHLCGKAFRHLKNKELHVKRHFKQRDYKCGICEFYGYTFTDIRKHIERRHSDAKTGTCLDCGLVFKNKEELEEHKTGGQCQPASAESSLVVKKENTGDLRETKDSPMLEMTLDILGESEDNQEPNSGENPGEKMSSLQQGQLVLSSDGILSSQHGQIVVNGLEGADLLSSDNTSLLAIENDSNKLITFVTTDGKNFSLPLKDLSTSTNLESVLNSDKNNSVETLFLSEFESESTA